MKKTPKANSFLEYMWLIISILTGLKGIIDSFKLGIETSYMFFIISFLALILYLARRSLRLKYRKDSENETT
jgi:hypothetical protein